jgi:uncharacterized membrane protein
VISFAINIPLNDGLAAGTTDWTAYLAKWNPANNLRAVAGALSVIAFALALIRAE